MDIPIHSPSPAPQRFGALNMIAALGPWLMRHPDVKGNMETFVMQFVTPEFKSEQPYLRAIVSCLLFLHSCSSVFLTIRVSRRVKWWGRLSSLG